MGLGEGLAAVELSGAPMLVQDLSGRPLAEDPVTSLRVLRRDAAVEWRGLGVAGIRVVPAGAAPLRFQQRLYPGIIEVMGAPEGLIVVNELPLEEYLVGAVKAEAGDKMPIEMLKAQAIVARTYAAYHRRLNAAKPYHIVAEMHDEARVVTRNLARDPSRAACPASPARAPRWPGWARRP